MYTPQHNDPATQQPGRPAETCPACRGFKELVWKDENGDVKRRTCPACHGSGVKGLRTK